MYRAPFLIVAAFVAAFILAANGPPLSSSWNIATSGSAASSGDLAFRITPGDGSDPVDITVPVISGASHDSVARSIGRALSSQLRRDLYSVQVGESGNVLVSDPRGRPNFSLELVDSDIENVRIAVQSVTPAAPPTVPPQGTPANPPVTPATPATPPAPGDSTPRANVPAPTTPPPSNSPAGPNPTPPPNATPGGTGPANAPPPNATPGGNGPANAPPPNATPGGTGPANAPPPNATPGGSAPPSTPPGSAPPPTAR